MKSKLIAYVRDSSSSKYVFTSCSHLRLKEQLKEAMDELGRLREARERQKEMVKAIVNQRDMYQHLLAQATPLPTAGDEVYATRTYTRVQSVNVCSETHTHSQARPHTCTLHKKTHREVHCIAHMMYSHAIRISQYLMELLS